MALIMVVEDNKDTSDSLRSLLVRNGYKVIESKNVDECLKKMDKEEPKMILTDLLMPGKSVNELIDNYPYIKFIIISAYLSENIEKSIHDKKLITSLKSKNVVGKIIKPFDNDKLIGLIKKNLED
jgi:DNA-binding NtrC family response regulator